jgi:hypothetical protein
MTWYAKEKTTPFDTLPLDGLLFLDGDMLAQVYLQEWLKGQKYPLIEFPSGFMAPLQESSDPANPLIHLFGELDLPYRQSCDKAFRLAQKIARQIGYVVKKRGRYQLEVRGYEDEEHLLLSYHSALHYIQDIQQLPPSESLHAIHPAHILLNNEIAASLPPLYANEKALGLDAKALVKYFHPSRDGWIWFVSEASALLRDGTYKALKEVDLRDPEILDVIFFGLVIGYEIELGNFSLRELQGIGQEGLGLPIERDLYYQPKSLRELRVIYRHERGEV